MNFDKEKTKRSGSWYQLDRWWNVQSPRFFETRTRELQHFKLGIDEETDILSAESIDCRASIKGARRETRKNRVRRPGFKIDTRFYAASSSNHHSKRPDSCATSLFCEYLHRKRETEFKLQKENFRKMKKRKS